MSEGTGKGLLIILSFIGFAFIIGLVTFANQGSVGTILDIQRQMCQNTPGTNDAECARKFPNINTLSGERLETDVDDYLNKSSIDSKYRSALRQFVTETSGEIHITEARYEGSGNQVDVWVNQEAGVNKTHTLMTNIVDDLPLAMRNEVTESNELIVYRRYEVGGEVKEFIYITPDALELIQSALNEMIQEFIDDYLSESTGVGFAPA